MACPAAEYDGFRPYRRPSIRAKFQACRKKSEEDLRHAIENAKLQQHVLQSVGSWQTGRSRCDDMPGRARVSVHDLLRHQTKKIRTSWLPNSTSSIKRKGESNSKPPVVVDPPPSGDDIQVVNEWPDEKWEQAQQKGPKLERRPARKEVRREEKKKKEEEKEAKKKQKAQEKRDRNELHRRVTEARARKTNPTHPRPAIDEEEPECFSARSATAHSWKRPLLKLSIHHNHPARSRKVIPMPSDFEDKAQLHAYLNTEPSTIEDVSSIPQIPELPAGPPPYNPLESSDLPDPNQASNHALITPSIYNCAASKQITTPANPLEPATYHGSSKPMLCDVCLSGIGLKDVFYQCMECDGGDRILCSTCTEAGRRCRHQQTARVSSVQRTPDETNAGDWQHSSCESVPIKHLSSSDNATLPSGPAAKDPWTTDDDQVFAAANADIQKFEMFQRVEAMFRGMQLCEERVMPVKDHEKSHLQKEVNSCREQDLVYRERAIVLREQEAALREREASLREREAALSEQRAMFSNKLPLSATTCPDPRHRAQTPPNTEPVQDMCNITEKTKSPPRPDPSPKKEARRVIKIILQELLNESGIQSHGQETGTKRKADSGAGQCHSRESSAHSSKSKPNHPSSAYTSRVDDDLMDQSNSDDDNPPKRRKQGSNTLVSGAQRLLACPYAKCDPVRYSERNLHEKHYRGCSGRYLTDISRLKQHLYRVHARPTHACPRCFEVFKSKDLLDLHARQQVLCQVSECQFSEKFTEDKMKELKRKRPGKSIEDSWYIIFGILFPNTAPPESPYIDELHGSNTAGLPASERTTTGIDSELSLRTENLLDIFNEQLSAHQHAEQHSWLASREARALINQTLALSMTEMLRRISPSNTPSVSVGRTPSILISPTSAQPRSMLQTPATSIPTSPVEEKGKRRSTPWLSPLQTNIPTAVATQSASAIQQFPPPISHVPDTFAQMSMENQWTKTEARRSPSPELVLADMDEIENFLGNNSDDFLPYTYHDHSQRTVSDIDTDAIGLAISPTGNDIDENFDFDFEFANKSLSDGTTAFHDSDSGSENKFFAVKVSSLNDTPLSHTAAGWTGEGNATNLKMTASKRSLDSGYESFPSRGPSLHKQSPEPIASADLAFLNQGIYETLSQAYLGELDDGGIR